MKALLVLLLAGVTTPALAQKVEQATPAPTTNATCTPEHAAMGHCKLPAPEKPPVDPHAGHTMPAPQRQQSQPDPHAGHQMPVQEPPVVDPHAGHQMPAEQQSKPTDPHAGHQMPAQQQADPHAGHDMGATAAPEVQPGPPPPEALAGPKHAADAYWGTEAMQRGRNFLREEHGGLPAYRFLVDRAETRVRDGRDAYLLDVQAWYGGDIDKLWLKGELEGSWGKKPEHAEIQALWSHAIDPWFDLQAGVRFDPQPGPNRTHLVLGFQGLALYWWEVEGAVFLSNKGEVTARAEAEYDLRITQKLILQPRAEVDLSFQDVPELAIGSGLTSASLGARLRYQVSPLVAPYIGVEYERAFGDTRRFLRADGENPGGFNLLAGVRFWF
jgi:copper resistance protein B